MKTTAKATTKKIASTAAVLPIVDSKSKSIFLKTAAANADRSKDATIKALNDKNYGNFDADLKAFVRQNGSAKVWTSRIAKVQPSKLQKAIANQIAFWTKQGYSVINAANFAA